jgi:hypothetical protein
MDKQSGDKLQNSAMQSIQIHIHWSSKSFIRFWIANNIAIYICYQNVHSRITRQFKIHENYVKTKESLSQLKSSINYIQQTKSKIWWLHTSFYQH